ncbi:MAG: hypothetical protein KGD60_09445 [Candidatus Thorarchaeota archaeon]|nr:hypothetical protein [Candidatus Thorarchaeota archaeon]
MTKNFPDVTGNNLNGDNIRIPSQLKGEVNVLLVPFQMWQQGLVNSWVPFLEHLMENNPHFDFYELPTIRKMNFFIKRMIDGGMRGGIPSRDTRGRTITLYIDKKPFKDALEIPTEDTLYLYLVDKEGTILWEESGELSDEKATSLENALVKAQSE